MPRPGRGCEPSSGEGADGQTYPAEMIVAVEKRQPSCCWGFPCRVTYTPRTIKTFLLWVSVGWGAEGPSVGWGSVTVGHGALGSVGSEAASSTMPWRRASPGPQPEGLGAKHFCSAEPSLLCSCLNRAAGEETVFCF